MTVLRYTFAANYVIQRTRTTSGFYNNKTHMPKTNLSQIAKTCFLKKKNPTNPHTKNEQTNKQIPVELSWFPE